MMLIRALVLWWILVLVPVLARAEETRAPEIVPSPLVIRILQRTMVGQPVIGVGIPTATDKDTQPEKRFAHDASLRNRLKAIGEAATTGRSRLIPFTVGCSWTLAPATRDEFVLPNPETHPIAAMTRRGAMDCFLGSLTMEQVRRLGSTDGLPARDLRGTARMALAQVLRPPLGLVTCDPASGEPDGEEPVPLDRPLDWSAMRIFGALRVHGVQFGADPTGTATLDNSPLPLPCMLGPIETDEMPARHSVDIPAFVEVPNRYKPSDLHGSGFRQPIGVSGVMKVREAVERAARATGLRLAVSPLYRDVPVFLGAASIPSGDVLDALRLVLCGAWRRLGTTYVLAWDVDGLAVLQQQFVEATEAVGVEVDKVQGDVGKAPGWARLATELAFDPRDPLALTREQRKKALAGRGTGTHETITFDEMTSRQQGWVRSGVKRANLLFPVSEDEGGGERAIGPGDVDTASVNDSLHVDISIEEPSIGRVRLEQGIGSRDIQREWDLFPEVPAPVAPDASPEEHQEDEIPEDLPEALRHPTPQPLRASVCGIITPAFAAGRLAELAREMKRAGFNGLFYPALFEGYATFPSAAFPQHPALRGADGLAAAVEAMRGTGIRVVAVVNVQAWRSANQPVHWLNRHPDWLERDMLGRSRLEWWAEHPARPDEKRDDPFLDWRAVLGYDYVRASEPAVQKKLAMLISELAARKDVSGVMLAGWRDDGGSDNCDGLLDPMRPQPLGFADADRLETLNETGVDPVDLSLCGPPFLPFRPSPSADTTPCWNALTPEWKETGWAQAIGRTASPQAKLASDLLAQAKSLRKDWATYLACSFHDGMPDLQSPALTRPDHAANMNNSADDRNDSLMLPVTVGATEDVHDDMLPPNVPIPVLMNFLYEGFILRNKPALPHAVILDFQYKPGYLTEWLHWFRPFNPGEVAWPLPPLAAGEMD